MTCWHFPVGPTSANDSDTATVLGVNLGFRVKKGG